MIVETQNFASLRFKNIFGHVKKKRICGGEKNVTSTFL